MTYRPPQPCPFIKIATMLALGIMAGDMFVPACHTDTLLCVMLVATCAAVAAHLHARGATATTLLILADMALVGAWRAAYDKRHDEVAFVPHAEHYEAVVASTPVEKERTVLYELLVTRGRLAGQRMNAYMQRHGNDTHATALRIGDGISATSRIDSAAPGAGGGNAQTHFDHARWLRTHGIVARTFIANGSWQRCATRLDRLTLAQRASLRLQRLRRDVLQGLPTGQLPQTTTAVVAAMTMGDRSLLTREIRQTYATSGASHILALSGLHLGIIYGMLSMMFARRRTRTVGRAVSVVIVWAYAMMVGMPPSVARSATMLTVFAFASAASRRPVSPNTLATAVAVLLGINPASLWDVGLQMSVMAVAGILVCNERLRDVPSARCTSALPPLKWIWGMTKVSLSAQIAVAPLTAHYFGTLPCYFLLANIIATPLATAIICGTLATLAMSFAPMLQAMAMKVVGMLATAMNDMLGWVASLPGASITGVNVSGTQVAAIYALMALALWLSAYICPLVNAPRTRRPA